MANTYLSYTQGTPTNNKKWTWSAWLKLGKVSGARYIMSSYVDANNATSIRILDTTSYARLDFQNYVSSSDAGRLKTSRHLRDPSAWYHVVCIFDSDNSTSGDRQQIWINGVRETAFDTETYPSSGAASIINANTRVAELGRRSDNSDMYDGIMSHVHFCDGQAYSASTFGSFDATSGIWVANTSPSVTYGNNGYFMKFASGASGTDSSGEGNNMTVSGTLINTKDNPDNNYATWDNTVPITNSNYQMTFENGNTSVIPTSPDANGSRNYATSTLSMPKKGKYYAEFKLISNDDVAMVGILAAEQVNYNFVNNTGTGSSTGTMVYDLAGGRILYNNVAQATGYTAVTNGNILGLAIDMDNEKFYVYVNGTLQNSSGETFTGKVLGDAVVFNCGDNTGSGYDKIQANFGNGYFGTTAITTNSGAGYAGADGKSKFNYQPRANHVALSTIGLNT